VHRLRRLGDPYVVWMATLILLPTVFLVLLSFSDLSFFRPGGFTLTLSQLRVFGSPIVRRSLSNSFLFASGVSVASFLIGYPVAYLLTTLRESTKRILMAILILPLWTNMLVRITAWERIFSQNSIFSDVFGFAIPILGTAGAVWIGLLAMYLPFMILPLFSVLDKMDKRLIEAAKDLGANDVQTFLRVVLPLSASGIVSGFIMTFLPSLTAFALPETLGWRNIPMIGMEIQKQFILKGFEADAINQGAVISLSIMAFSVLSFLLIAKVDKEGETLL